MIDESTAQTPTVEIPADAQPEATEQPLGENDSFMILIFEAPGSAQFGMQVHNVSPAQMSAAASFLKWKSEHAWEQSDAAQAERERQQAIALPDVNANALRGGYRRR